MSILTLQLMPSARFTVWKILEDHMQKRIKRKAHIKLRFRQIKADAKEALLGETDQNYFRFIGHKA